MGTIRVGIIGSRGFADVASVRRFVDTLSAKYPHCIVVSRDTRGVDRVAIRAAKANALMVTEHVADWQRDGKRAVFLRNDRIVAGIDVLVAFWDGQSRGTADAIAKARARGRKVIVYGLRANRSEPSKQLPEPTPLTFSQQRAAQGREQLRLQAEWQAAVARPKYRKWWDHELGEGSERALSRVTEWVPEQGDAPDRVHYDYRDTTERPRWW